MRKWIVLLFLLVASPCWADGLVIGWPATGGGTPTQRGFDDFSGTLSNWTSVATDGFEDNWSIVSTQLRNFDDPWTPGLIYYSAASASTSSQYAKGTIANLGASAEGGIVVRLASPSSLIGIVGASSYTDIYYPDYATQVAHNTGVTWASTDSMCVTVSGTSLRIWKNCTGTTPDSATSWGSDTTPDISYTLASTSGGTYCGFMNYANIYYDDFYFGDL